MPKGQASGYRLTAADLPIVFGMVARGDLEQDIAGWFGVNQGRVPDAKNGKYGTAKAAPENALPPKGPPGIKGRRLRGSVGKAIQLLGSGKQGEALSLLKEARAKYDADEP